MFEKVPFKATYYREPDTIHVVQNGKETDHLASYREWGLLAENMKNYLPAGEKHLLITPEYATLESLDMLADLNGHADEIIDNIEYAKDLTKQTEAGILLGTPTRQWIPGTAITPGRMAWRNSALHIRRGEIVDVNHKSYILPGEEDAGIEADKRHQHQTILGERAVLLCADLYGFDPRNQPLLLQMARQAIVLASWANPLDSTKTNILPIADQDAYYRETVEFGIEASFNKFPKLRKITMTDRGTDQIRPFSFVAERID